MRTLGNVPNNDIIKIYRERGVKYTLNTRTQQWKEGIRRRAAGGRKVAATNHQSKFGRPRGNESPPSCSLCSYVSKEF
jgi:hypothetical protein